MYLLFIIFNNISEGFQVIFSSHSSLGHRGSYTQDLFQVVFGHLLERQKNCWHMAFRLRGHVLWSCSYWWNHAVAFFFGILFGNVHVPDGYI